MRNCWSGVIEGEQVGGGGGLNLCQKIEVR